MESNSSTLLSEDVRVGVGRDPPSSSPRHHPRQPHNRVGTRAGAGGRAVSQPPPSPASLSAKGSAAMTAAYHMLNDSEHVQHIVVDEELRFFVFGYRRNRLKVAAFYLACLCTGGLLFLLSRWIHKLHLLLTATPCPLAEATVVFIRNHWEETLILPITKAPFHGATADIFPNHRGRGHGTPRSGSAASGSHPSSPSSSSSSAAFLFGRMPTSGSAAGAVAPTAPLDELVYFEYRYIRFLFNPMTRQFQSTYSWVDPHWSSVPSVLGGLDSEYVVAQRKAIFGNNSVDIQEKPTLKLLVEEVLHPFFVFQVASILLWSLDNYYYYAACIFVISAASTIVTLVETKANMRRMRELSRFVCLVRVLRAGVWMTVSSEELVPGDVFEISSHGLSILPCDGVLLEGECIINESMLTGESIPVSKVAISDLELEGLDLDEEEPESSSRMSRFFLFSGTKIIRVRPGGASGTGNSGAAGGAAHLGTPRSLVKSGSLSASTSATSLTAYRPHPDAALGMVVRIGFNTTKGALVRSMLFPKPNNFSFYRDSFRFIGVLAIIAGLGFIGSVYNFVRRNIPWHRIFIRALDLITIVVPPALPATMAIGTSFAISRLRKYNIFCISPPRVNICGKLEVMVFDKTGTLTEDGLDVLGFRFTVPISLDAAFLESTREPTSPGPLRFSSLYKSVDAVIARPMERGVREGPASTYSHSSRFSASPRPNVYGTSLHLASLSGHPNGSEPDYPYPLIVCAMASCHSIKVVDGEKIGDPLDLKIFEFTGWSIEEGGNAVHPDPNVPSAQVQRALMAERQRMADAELGDMATIVRPPFTGEFKQNDSQTDLGIIRSFDFLSSLRRMSVIVCRIQYADFSGDQFSDVFSKGLEVFVKGAPEVMHSICDPKTLPSDFDIQLKEYAHHGYRVIACAWRKLDPMPLSKVSRLSRNLVESNLHFLGFVVFENKVKAGTTTVVETLEKAKIRQIMCTGDNILTAVSVSRECGLISRHKVIFIPRFLHGDSNSEDAQIVWEDADESPALVDPVTFKLIPSTISHPVPYELAVTGDVFQWMVDYGSRDSLHRMLVKTQVYARMSPDQKTFLVEKLQGLGYIVGFTGDGANDCGALTQADCGMSLSEAEASVAAPFTSKSTDLDCVLRVIREGRAALVTSFSCFKYMALYSLIQFTSVTILYSLNRNLADFQFMYIDICVIIPVAIFMSYSGPNPDIHPKRPTASLMSKRVITSLVGQVILQAVFQLLGFFWVLDQPWYSQVTPDPDGNNNYISYDASFVFLLSTFQYLAVAVVFNNGPPYRDHMFKNGPFMLTVVLITCLNVWLVMSPTEFVQEWMELSDFPPEARWTLLSLALAHFLLAWMSETLVFPLVTSCISRLQNRVSASVLSTSSGLGVGEVESMARSHGGLNDGPLGMGGGGMRRSPEPHHLITLTPRQRELLAKRKRWEAKGKLYKIIAQDLSNVVL